MRPIIVLPLLILMGLLLVSCLSQPPPRSAPSGVADPQPTLTEPDFFPTVTADAVTATAAIPPIPIPILPTLAPTEEKMESEWLGLTEKTGGREPGRAATESTLYHLPIAAGAMNVDWFIGSYVDVDRQIGRAVDYAGGFMTYDNHKGTDFFIRDLAQMEAGVPVLAARAGTVVALRDSAQDFDWESAESNYVKIVHGDGSFAIYSHLKQGSVTVEIGDRMTVGQPLALVGNSGASAHPHLHFEVHEQNGRLVDIFGEQQVAFDYPYPHQPFIFDMGITNQDDPYIFANLARYTPNHQNSLTAADRPHIWYRVIGMRRQDQLHTVLVYPNGEEKALLWFTADQDYRYVYWVVYEEALPVGTYAVLSYFNGDRTHATITTLYVTQE